MDTKTRAPNWTQEEVHTLVMAYKERKDVIDGKVSNNNNSHGNNGFTCFDI